MSILTGFAYVIGGGVLLAFAALVAGYVREYFVPYEPRKRK